jgi:hypothetical protein
MARETVVVGCRLPNGIVLQHPKNPDMRVTLQGAYAHKSESGLYMPPRPYGTTVVDAELWAAWKEEYQGSPLLKTRAIFEAKSESEAAAKGRELEKEKTGLEAMPQSVVVDGTRLERARI